MFRSTASALPYLRRPDGRRFTDNAILQTMHKQKQQKINQLQDILAEGLLAPTNWLEGQGYSRALIAGYVRSGWLVSPARGVYRRPGPGLKWQNIVASLQHVMGKHIHVGGRSALIQYGRGHYVRMGGESNVTLYGLDPLPPWVNSLGLVQQFEVRRDNLFRGSEIGIRDVVWGAWDWKLKFSTEERAILEFLAGVPNRESIHDAYVIMQSLVTLRPVLVTDLLQTCTSVKVKRLFLALADMHHHSWLSHVDLTNVELGSGKRMIVRGGKLHPRYQITLPADLDGNVR